jgi:RNA polymerase sigma factor (TIGR02999 family)
MTDRDRTAGNITRLLDSWSQGDRASLDEMMPLVHTELKRLARRQLGRERQGHTIQPTALVNEAYLRLAAERGMHWQDRAHFFAVAANLMRFVLVDYARRRQARRRGSGRPNVALDSAIEMPDMRVEDVLCIDAALLDLAKVDGRKARVVELRVFGGLTVEESAYVLGVSAITVARDWRFARSWLQRQLTR